MPALRAVELIERKRAGKELTKEEIEELVSGYVRGEIPDYQVSAWLMAVCLRGLSQRETVDLTWAMAASGAMLDLAGVGWPVADKHSSGGVGDKTTLVVGPLVRACGVAVAKMSGRGLGFTGGTVDKLESIPGYVADLSAAQFVRQLEREGIVLAGQSPELVPADRKLYALRDVTGTVESIPLIASSIMCKKLAVGAQAVVLDVKVGSGAFMAELGEARELARLMVDIGTAANRRVSALLTPMDQPLGMAVGNALEVAEAIATLRGDGPRDLVELCVLLAGEMLYLAGAAGSPQEGRERAQKALDSGDALQVMERLLLAQGGDPRVLENPGIMGRAPHVLPVTSHSRGWVAGVDARGVARAALSLGAGRARKEDAVDHQVGVVLRVKAGSEVEEGTLLAEVHARDASVGERAAAEVLRAFRIEDVRPEVAPDSIERVGPVPAV
ncbi:MAG: thymidine phosphorylase [Sphingomonadaceae bacterium]